jgi:EAL domain-containing protein (putative c-di-GMP-specific phosphodiesterase class I)
LPIYRAAHRQVAPSTSKLRQQRFRRASRVEDLAKSDALDVAIEQDQLRLFYHPIVHLAGTSVVGHEVLIRWQHPVHGLLGPSEFLPAIDADPVSSRKLGAWVLHQSCVAAMERNEQLHVSVNISPNHLTEAGFAGHVIQTLRSTGFAPSMLILELVQESVVNPSPAFIDTCAELIDVGVTLALDDYGSTPIPDVDLDSLPLEMLKIDPRIIAGIGTDPASEELVLAAIKLAAATGRRTIAEGVETHTQAHFLRENEATFAQGYLYGRPHPR